MPSRASFVVQPLDPAVLGHLARALRKLKHDLSNSLVAAMGEMELLAADVGDVGFADRLLDARTSLLRPFLDLRRTTMSLPLVDGAPQRWADLRAQLDARAQTVGAKLDWQPEALETLNTDPPLRPIVAALVNNALDAAQAGVTVRVAFLAPDAAGWRGLVVSDDGPGCKDLAAAAQGHLQRAGGAHLGLGLAVAATLLAARGGKLTLQAATPHGLEAAAKWPTG